MSDRIAVMNGGRIEQVDTPGRLYERPATRFVADFIGESNIIPMTAPGSEADGRLLSAIGPLAVRRNGSPDGAWSARELVVRPEKIRFADDAQLDNVLNGTVTEVVYTGDATKYRVRVTDEVILTVKRQNRAGQADYAVDDAVTIGWRAEDGSIV